MQYSICWLVSGQTLLGEMLVTFCQTFNFSKSRKYFKLIIDDTLFKECSHLELRAIAG